MDFQGELPSALDSFFQPPAGGGNADTSGLSDKLYEYFDGSKDSPSREYLQPVVGKHLVLPMMVILIHLKLTLIFVRQT